MKTPAIPTFALVGQPNEGKTTVMATLAEDDQAAISPIPGTTRSARRYPVRIGDREILAFYDTPGFENAGAVLEWFEAHRSEPSPVDRFMAESENSGRFGPEVEILRPLQEGAAAIYVADGSRPVRAVDQQEIDILRLAGVRRIGVINSKEGPGRYVDDWKRLMARDFNHIHEFNGHRATFRDRLRLLEAVQAVIQEWEDPMKECIRAIRNDWDARLRSVTGEVVSGLRDLLEIRASVPIDFPGEEANARKAAREKLQDSAREQEQRFRGKVRRIFRHSEERWTGNELLDADLFNSEEVWRVLGLTRSQLVIAAAATGALIGGTVDVALGGASFFVGALAGGGVGAVVGWFSAEKAVDVELPDLDLGGIRISGRRLGGRQAQASINPQSNVIWIMMDRWLMYVALCTNWAHGRRETNLPGRAEEKQGATSHWSREERGRVARFVGLVRKEQRGSEKLDEAERAVRELIQGKLRDMTV